MAKKKATPVLRTPKQLEKECQDYLKSALSEIRYQCQNATTDSKAALIEAKQSIKGYQAEIKTLEGKRAAATSALAKKKTKTAENTLKKGTAKLKETKRLLQQATKLCEKLSQEVAVLTEVKTKAKAREAALKTFEKSYQSPVKPAAKKTKTVKTKALIEAGLRPGDTAPNFTSVLEDNKAIALTQFKGKNVVLYFYPKDNTPGCTTEAKDFTAMADEFTAKNTVILGVSRDSMTSHKKFAEKFSIPYILLPDTDETICNAYGVIKNKNMYGKKVRGIERSTFLVDDKGILKQIWRGVKVPGHVEAVLEEIN